jgi:hypothetical protein
MQRKQALNMLRASLVLLLCGVYPGLVCCWWWCCIVQVSGDRVSALVRGWHVGSLWRLSSSSLLLQQPAIATWEFTPELAA